MGFGERLSLLLPLYAQWECSCRKACNPRGVMVLMAAVGLQRIDTLVSIMAAAATEEDEISDAETHMTLSFIRQFSAYESDVFECVEVSLSEQGARHYRERVRGLL